LDINLQFNEGNVVKMGRENGYHFLLKEWSATAAQTAFTSVLHRLGSAINQESVEKALSEAELEAGMLSRRRAIVDMMGRSCVSFDY
jgi:hypothetical protein